VRTGPVQLSSDETLRCPFCGHDYLHHGRVEVFTRLKEDAPSIAVTLDGCNLPVLGASGCNPSSRRQGLLIYFNCENCGRLPVALGIAQHKGNTFVTWESV
jgi:hypothetical protein